MKLFKKATMLTLAVIMLMSVLTTPASALDGVWQNIFADFPELYEGHTSAGHIQALQRFLYCYSDYTKAALTEGGAIGIDGGFGEKTTEAVRRFQEGFIDLVDDGRPGENTWRKIALLLDDSSANVFTIENLSTGLESNVIYHTIVGSSTALYTYNAYNVRYPNAFETVRVTAYSL